MTDPASPQQPISEDGESRPGFSEAVKALTDKELSLAVYPLGGPDADLRAATESAAAKVLDVVYPVIARAVLQDFVNNYAEAIRHA